MNFKGLLRVTALVAPLFFGNLAFAQCPSIPNAQVVTQTVGCYGIDAAGCCTTKLAQTNTGTITVDAVQFCYRGNDGRDYLCLLVCPPSNPQVSRCGWVSNGQQAMYDCTSAPAPGPSGYRKECHIPCGNVGNVGCCEGDTLLKVCKNGNLNFLNCAANTDPSLKKCGWDPALQEYSCYGSTADSGNPAFPRSCNATCTPNCNGKECGDNGCGGTCGQCVAGKSCQNGVCVTQCTPNCNGRDCGDDGCGGSCGQCAAGKFCQNGVCVAQCTPNCAGRDCGDDGCGGSCGECVVGWTCKNGVCVKKCTPNCNGKACGDDGCGGSCGQCSGGAICTASGKCVGGADVMDSGNIDSGSTSPDDSGYFPGPGICPDGFIYHYGTCVRSDDQKSSSSSSCSTYSGRTRWYLFLFVPLFLLFMRKRIDN